MARPELFPQEHPSTWEEAFLASGMMIFYWEAIKKLDEARPEKGRPKWTGHIASIGSDLKVEPDLKGPLKIWRSPDARTKYLIVADSSEGIPGAAWSVADVFDIRTWEQVAQWRGYIAPDKFGQVIAMLGGFYEWALVAPESNFPGNAVIKELTDLRYPNMYGEADNKTHPIGFYTSEKTKSLYISDGRAAVRDLEVKVNSDATINELRTFVLQQNGTMGPQAGCFQDCVITLTKAASILKRLDPSMVKETFRDVMRRSQRMGGFSRPSGGGASKIV